MIYFVCGLAIPVCCDYVMGESCVILGMHAVITCTDMHELMTHMNYSRAALSGSKTIYYKYNIIVLAQLKAALL